MLSFERIQCLLRGCGQGLSSQDVAWDRPGPLLPHGFSVVRVHTRCCRGAWAQGVSVEGEWKHFGGGNDQRELGGGVTAVKKYGHKALTCRKLDHVSSAAHRATYFVFWITVHRKMFPPQSSWFVSSHAHNYWYQRDICMSAMIFVLCRVVFNHKDPT